MPISKKLTCEIWLLLCSVHNARLLFVEIAMAILAHGWKLLLFAAPLLHPVRCVLAVTPSVPAGRSGSPAKRPAPGAAATTSPARAADADASPAKVSFSQAALFVKFLHGFGTVRIHDAAPRDAKRGASCVYLVRVSCCIESFNQDQQSRPWRRTSSSSAATNQSAVRLDT